MDKFCKESNPSRKMEALFELKMLVVSHIREKMSSKTSDSNLEPDGHRQPRASLPSSRRSSLNQMTFNKTQHGEEASTQDGQDTDVSMPSEPQIVQHLKGILLETKPRTLFRDLQYISAFVPSDVTNKTESGQAFLHVGLAALAYKDDVCRSMVDVAAKIIATDSVKRLADRPGTPYTSLIDAASFLTLAAKEGNPVAQRELASLYLAHPGLLQPHSLPLTLPRETFRSEMMYWQLEKLQEPHTEAMCLALHWMQHAANNGDEIARRNLMEREGSNSIR
jgi:chromatin assembly factor 1 subunit A